MVLVASQFPVVLESEAWALASSLSVTVVVAAATLLLVGNYAPLPLFALLLALHTMLPLSRSVAMVLAAIITVAYFIMSVAKRYEAGVYSQYIQVCILIYNISLLFYILR